MDSVKDITQTNPHKMFEHLFRATLDYRLTEDTFSRVRARGYHMYNIYNYSSKFSHFYKGLFVHSSIFHIALLSSVLKSNDGTKFNGLKLFTNAYFIIVVMANVPVLLANIEHSFQCNCFQRI